MSKDGSSKFFGELFYVIKQKSTTVCIKTVVLRWS